MDINENIKEAPLINKDTLLLLQGFFISIYGDYVFEIAVAFLVLKMTGSAAMMSIIMVLSILPSTLLSPFAGVVVDRVNKKWMMVSMDIIRGFSTVLLAIVFILGKGTLALISLNVIILSVCKPFFQLASNCLIPIVCNKKNLVRLSGIASIGLNISSVAAKSSAGFLLSLLGAPILFLLNGITFILSGISEIFIGFEEKLIIDDDRRIFDKFKDDVVTAIDYIKEDACYRLYVTFFMILMFLSSMTTTITIPFFNKYYNPEIYGMAASILTISSIISSALLSYFKKLEYTKLFIISITITCLARIIYPFYGLTVIIVLFFISGFFTNITNLIFNNILIVTIDENVRAKVMGISLLLIFGFQVLGTLLGGLLAEFIDLRYIIATSNLILLFITMVLYIKRNNVLKQVNKKLGCEY